MKRPLRVTGCGVGICLTLFVTAVNSTTSDRGDEKKDRREQEFLRRETLKIHTAYLRDLSKATEWGLKNGLLDESRGLLARIDALDAGFEGLTKLRSLLDEAEGSSAGGTSPADDRKTSLEKKVERVQADHAKRCYGFAVRCFKHGLFTRAFDLLNEVLVQAPSQSDRHLKKARKILGYVWDKDTEEWITNWEAKQKKQHYLTPEGWVQKKNRTKWEQGLRPFEGDWISADEEQQIRSRNVYNPYVVESEHFRVKTTLGREEAWFYAGLLEDFDRQFYRFFVGFYDQVAGAKLLFNRANLADKHEVILFRDKAAYLKYVKAEQGNNELLRNSAGFYSHGDRRSRFYWTQDLETTLSTFYHEVAHQLFAETKENKRGGSIGNNWVVEGIASYVETWEKIDGKWYPGRKIRSDESRMKTAAMHLASNEAWRLADFVRIDHPHFHGANRNLNYALSCALCHFFLHYNDEIYKEDFVHFLSDYYGGKVTEGSLADYIDVPDATGPAEVFGKLEEEFRTYLSQLDLG